MPSFDITQDRSSSVSPGDRWPGPIGALFNPEPALPKLQRDPLLALFAEHQNQVLNREDADDRYAHCFTAGTSFEWLNQDCCP